MLTEIDLLAQRRADFGFETTLSGRSYLRFDWSIEKPGLCRALLLSLAVER
jgi:predicted ABC-type ATPase